MSDSGKQFRAGLVGAGHICEFHVAALRRAGVEVVGLTDIDSARAAQSAEKLKVRAYPSLAALVEAGANVVHVLTPPHAHAPVALEALDRGCHVLVEKPLAVEAEDCLRIDARAAEKGLQVCVNHSLLYDPQVRKALEAVRAGKLGKVVSVDILRSSAYPPYGGGPMPPQYRTAGYPFRDIGVHCLYLMQALLGPIEKIDAEWASLGGDPNLAYDEWRAQVRCRDGLGQFQLSWNVRPIQSQIIIQGTKGVLRADLFLMFNALRKSGPLPKAAERVFNAISDSVRPLVQVPLNVAGVLLKKVLPYHGLQMLVADFYRCLAAGKPAPVTVADATPVVEWTERVARDADREYAGRVGQFVVGDRVPYLVTGASGALGSAVVERLLAEGHRVRVLVRRAPKEVREGVEVVIGDLGDPAAVEKAVRGAEVVIHAGAAMKGGWVEHHGSTVVGTQNVIDACVRRGGEVDLKLVHVSSMSVVDWANGSEADPITEQSPLEPNAEARGHYTRAKLEAERLVTNAVRERGLPAVILRPGQIFGGRIPILTPAVARRAGKRFVVLGDGTMRLPLVYMDDVVDSILAAARSDLRGGEIIQVIGDVAPTQNEVLEWTVGRDARVIRIPRPVVFTLGKLSEWMLKPLKRQSPLSAYRLRSGLARRTFRSDNGGALLNWRPRVGVREGVRRAMGGAPAPAGEAAAVETAGPPAAERPRELVA